MQFIISLTRTDQGRRGIKDTAKRVQASRELAKKMGVEIRGVLVLSPSDAPALPPNSLRSLDVPL
jgi:uncharacterized protein with GYD domain